MKYSSSVIPGQGRGKGIGYPTFNLQIPPKFPFKYGIYAGWVWIDSQKYPGAFHYGPVPVFNQAQSSLEVFVLDYSSNYLITSITFEPVKYLRPIKNFPTPQALSRQISRDVAQVKKLLSEEIRAD